VSRQAPQSIVEAFPDLFADEAERPTSEGKGRHAWPSSLPRSGISLDYFTFERRTRIYGPLRADPLLRAKTAPIDDTLSDLREQVCRLRAQVRGCRLAIGKVSRELADRPIVQPAWIHELGPDLELAQPLPVTIEEAGETVVASFAEVEAYGRGATASEAIAALKRAVTELYYELTEFDPETLGPAPHAWLRVLSRLVVVRSDG